jgi:hypothetical protein
MFNIEISTVREDKIQELLTYKGSAQTPQQYMEASLSWIDAIDIAKLQKDQLISEIQDIYPAFTQVNKTLQELQDIKTDLDAWKA